MKLLKSIFGLPMVYAGVAILAASYFVNLGPATNGVLTTGLLLVVAGTFGYMRKGRNGK